jgi:hypothetical protein
MTTAVAIEGTAMPLSGVREAFAQNFADYAEVGAAVAVMVDGRMAVDLWRHADAADPALERDTIANVFSTTKGITAICACGWWTGRLDIDAGGSTGPSSRAGKAELPVRYSSTIAPASLPSGRYCPRELCTIGTR